VEISRDNSYRVMQLMSTYSDIRKLQSTTKEAMLMIEQKQHDKELVEENGEISHEGKRKRIVEKKNTCA
jgi:hypothetical protein